MLFWIVAGTLATLVALLIARPLLAPPEPSDAQSPDLAFYREQLAEIGRDVARGTLPEAEAGRVRDEVARRLLAADRAGPPPIAAGPPKAGIVAAGVMAALLLPGSLALYAALGAPGVRDDPRPARLVAAEAMRAARPSQAEAEAANPPPAPVGADEDYLAMVETLRRAVPTRPDEVEGWRLLALHEGRLGRHADSARAQEQVVALLGPEVTPADLVGLADRMVAAAGGVVTVETEAVLDRLATLSPDDPGLLYHRGLLEAQVGRPDRAFPLWEAVIASDPPDGLHRTLALAQMADLAWLAGRDWTEPEAPPTSAAPGPTAADVADAAAMDEADRQAMIRGMVDGLASRLDAEGGPAADWARLVTALAILGDDVAARAALERARLALADDAAAPAILDEAARQAGVAG